MPFFTTVDRHSKLDKSDAKFVDVIHTNAGVFGKIEPSGHVDFYINGGQTQPACEQHKSISIEALTLAINTSFNFLYNRHSSMQSPISTGIFR